ncbi:MAG TPA: DUF916 domain-containing protein [Patescibacteria group bacterium]|nr:DUF916 domain-containing protein [Patescibacteria group bacterium]
MIRGRIFTAGAVVLIAVSMLTSIVWHSDAYAAQTSNVTGDALKISPVRWDFSVDPGTTKVIDFYIQNLTSVPAILHPAVNDFTAATDESGAPHVILDETQFAPSHSLKKFVKPMSDFTVQPHELKNIKATVVIPKDAAGGGYYGAIRFSPANAEGSKNVNLSASIGSLVLLRVNGTVSEQLSVASFDVRQQPQDSKEAAKVGAFFTSGKNLKSVVRFKNGGNIQVGPFGTVTLKKGKKTLSQVQINNVDPRGVVLPDSTRRFDVDVTKVGSFGKYTLEGNFGYGTTGQLLTAKTSFYVVPVPILLLAGIVLLFILFAIFVLPRMVRSYNKRVIRRASRRR